MNLKTNFRIAIGTLALAAALVIVPKPAPAQSNPDDAMQTVTGCLQSGPAANTYSLLDENGKLWDVSSPSIHFSEHVGHKVTLSGTIPQKPKTNAAPADSSPQNHLNVSNLKMVSDSCSS
jgi:hypothetical protein